MKVYKQAERIMNTSAFFAGMKAGGATIKYIGEWDKWKDLSGLNEGCRLQIVMNIYKIEMNGKTAYMLADSFDNVASELTLDKQEVINWLEEHGYKRDKQWYMEENGMDESTWNYWNGLEER